ncbi:acyl-CoA thioesterase [Oceanobacillus sp. CAU 1775]
MSSINYIDNFDTWRSEFEFSTSIKVRFSETDLYGHVNNTSVFVYFEEARIEYLQAIGLYDDIDVKKHGMVVADLQCNYLKQMFFNETIDFYVKVNEIGNSSADIHYMAVNEAGEVTLTGRGRVVFIDLEKGKPERIPESIKEKMIGKVESGK